MPEVTEAAEAAEAEHVYISKNAPQFRTSFEVDGSVFIMQFDNGKCRLTDEQAAVFDELYLSKPPVSIYVAKTDKAAAERAAAAFMAEQVATTGGTFTTEHLAKMHANTARANARLLADAAPNNPDALSEFQEELGGAAATILENVDTQTHAPNAPEVNDSNSAIKL